MRVVAGTARGRSLQTPPGRTTRPTSDRVREAVFNALNSLDALADATVLDGFAGSGAMGIEALSRGARHVTFVEADRRAVATIHANLAATGFTDRATVVPQRLESFLARPQPALPWDLVVLDPPYVFDAWDDLLATIRGRVVVIESDRPVSVPKPWDVVRDRSYGTTVVRIAEWRSTPSAQAPS
ncbi:MAG: 16S rRNA (guanine(966)-N(2))-methyltransferase RsmD [Microthrixaceae bacterium]|nr:16S rRNA (guanine(966)-N(2))-methyltransferase RsmD [Microthrixaceae bacterium]MCO5311960.1 16S rRNA (guanine(966)-N(2))-methyltransferase RsmD [Microthrixaceae bacterium]HPB45674.1 16S rRNA (guanine(966)-N(2))-methyltransferase RsmD [Microthrixaceae bacterium]